MVRKSTVHLHREPEHLRTREVTRCVTMAGPEDQRSRRGVRNPLPDIDQGPNGEVVEWSKALVLKTGRTHDKDGGQRW